MAWKGEHGLKLLREFFYLVKKEERIVLRRNWAGSGLLRSSGKPLAVMLVVMLMFSVLPGCSKEKAPQDAAAKKEVIELKLAHFWPATHPAEVELVQSLAREVEQATNGQVKITSYPGETLLKADAIYGGVVDGVADIGISCFAYTRGRFPIAEVFELPGIRYNNSQAASQVAWEGLQELNPAEIQDTKLLMVLTTGPGDLYTKVPVRQLSDMKGLEIRATGLSATTLEKLGAVPSAMPQSDAYEALSRGLVRGNLGPVEVLKGWKQAEVTKYVTKTPFLYNTLFFVTMNKAKWDSLGPENQKAVAEASQKVFQEVAMGLWDKQNEEAMKYAVDEKGMKVITLPAAEEAQWIKLVEPVQQDWVKRMDAKGLKGQETLDKVKALAEKYNQQYK